MPALVDAVGLAVAGRNIAFLAFAGHETTVHLLGNMLFHLAHAPAQWAALRADPHLVANAVAETLRLESPVQKICRWPVQPTEMDGLAIDKEQMVVLLVGAANRDPAQFRQAERFDVSRPGKQNLAFGRGAHVCIGKTLAEMEGKRLLEAVLRRWKSIELVPGGARWMDNSSIRGLDALALRIWPACIQADGSGCQPLKGSQQIAVGLSATAPAPSFPQCLCRLSGDGVSAGHKDPRPASPGRAELADPAGIFILWIGAKLGIELFPQSAPPGPAGPASMKRR